MAFEGLSERLENSFKKLRAKGKLTESDVKEAMREVRLALLEADVNYKVSKEFTAKVTERAIGADVMESLTPSQMVIKIVNEELTELMGGNEARLAIANHPPTIVMMCGLQGSGKTTHSAKLALKLKNRNANLLTDNLKLLNSRRTVNVTSYKKGSVSRLAFLFLKWVMKILFISPKRQLSLPKTTATTMFFLIRQVVCMLTSNLWRNCKIFVQPFILTKFCLLLMQ